MNVRSCISVTVKTVIAVMVASIACNASAAENIASVWVKALPGTKITASRPEPHFPGMYELVMGDKIVYGDATGRYLMFGHIYDTHTQQDITQIRLDSLVSSSHVNWGDMPLEYAVSDRKENDATKMAVLLSPSCGYCRKFYEEYSQGLREDINVHFLLLAAKNENSIAERSMSYMLADRIVCGVDPLVNLQVVMQGVNLKTRVADDAGKAPLIDSELLERKQEFEPGAGDVGGMCDSEVALDAVRKFASKYGLLATPTFISEDGRVHKGYMPKAELLAWLHSGIVVKNK